MIYFIQHMTSTVLSFQHVNNTKMLSGLVYLLFSCAEVTGRTNLSPCFLFTVTFLL